MAVRVRDGLATFSQTRALVVLGAIPRDRSWASAARVLHGLGAPRSGVPRGYAEEAAWALSLDELRQALIGHATE